MYGGIVLGKKSCLHVPRQLLTMIGCDKGALGRHSWDVPLAKVLGQASLVVRL